MGAIDQLRAIIVSALLLSANLGLAAPEAATDFHAAWHQRETAVIPDVLYLEQKPGFVTRSGSTLFLDGRPYRFVGLNIYNANSTGLCWYQLGTAQSVDATLNLIGSSQTVFRAWFFQSLATRNGQRDWSAFDDTLAAARAHNERVIATLGNQWADCEGLSPTRKTEAWYASGYATRRDAGLLATYRQWVAEAVNRYRDDPTILAWQLLNEAEDPSANGACSPTAPRTLRRFTEDMAGLVKGIDRNHLLSLGTSGVENCGTAGSAYQDIHSVGGIDLCETHDYSGPHTATPTTLLRRVSQCRALDKPLFVGEIGIRVQDAGSRANRATAIRSHVAAAFGLGAVGALVWDWANPDQAAYSGYEIQPGDPALGVLDEVL